MIFLTARSIPRSIMPAAQWHWIRDGMVRAGLPL